MPLPLPPAPDRNAESVFDVPARYQATAFPQDRQGLGRGVKPALAGGLLLVGALWWMSTRLSWDPARAEALDHLATTPLLSVSSGSLDELDQHHQALSDAMTKYQEESDTLAPDLKNVALVLEQVVRHERSRLDGALSAPGSADSPPQALRARAQEALSRERERRWFGALFWKSSSDDE